MYHVFTAMYITSPAYGGDWDTECKIVLPRRFSGLL